MSIFASDPRHGTIGFYTNHQCRCDLCKAANAEYYRTGRGFVARQRYREGGSGDLKTRYRLAREAGYSAKEAAKRRFWANPLA